MTTGTCTRNTVLLALPALLAGCAIERGTIDFADPLFDVHCGPIALIAFPSSTVLHVGSTYFILALPYYVPLVFIICLVAGLWFMLRRKGNAQER